MSERQTSRPWGDDGPDRPAPGRGAEDEHDDFEGSFEELGASDLRETLRRGEAELRAFVQRHPVAVLCGALAMGFLVGRLIREEEP